MELKDRVALLLLVILLLAFALMGGDGDDLRRHGEELGRARERGAWIVL